MGAGRAGRPRIARAVRTARPRAAASRADRQPDPRPRTTRAAGRRGEAPRRAVRKRRGKPARPKKDARPAPAAGARIWRGCASRPRAQLQQTRELIDDLRRQDPAFASGGTGFTFEGMGMTFSSPGTEGFKQDFAKWEALRDQATRALERAESSLSKRLQQKESSDRRRRVSTTRRRPRISSRWTATSRRSATASSPDRRAGRLECISRIFRPGG